MENLGKESIYLFNAAFLLLHYRCWSYSMCFSSKEKVKGEFFYPFKKMYWESSVCLLEKGMPLLWHSGLMFQCCHCSYLGCCSGTGSIPGWGTSTCCESSQTTTEREREGRKQRKKEKGYSCAFFHYLALPSFPCIKNLCNFYIFFFLFWPHSYSRDQIWATVAT